MKMRCRWDYNGGMVDKRKTKRRHDAPTTFRFEAADLKAFKEAAGYSGESLSNWVRRHLRAAARRELRDKVDPE